MGLTKPIEQNLLSYQGTIKYLKYIIRGENTMKKSKFLTRIIAVMAVISMLFLDLAGSGIQVANAATANEDPVLTKTEFRKILVGKS